MADITMCPGLGCEIKQDCYRFTATPTPERQSFFCEPPYLLKEETSKFKCKYFWLKQENKPKRKGNYSMGWFTFAISLRTGSRYDNGHFVSGDHWNSFPVPSDWEE